MSRVYPPEEIARIAKELPEALLAHANRHKAAKAVGLKHVWELMALVANSPEVAKAHKHGWDLLREDVLEAHMSSAMGRSRGFNTQASGRFLAADKELGALFNPATVIEDRSGYQQGQPAEDKEQEAAGESNLTVVNGGTPPEGTGTRG